MIAIVSGRLGPAHLLHSVNSYSNPCVVVVHSTSTAVNLTRSIFRK